MAALRIQGNDASGSDLKVFLEAITESEGFRQKCVELGSFVARDPRAEREDNCAALVGVLLADFAPTSAPRRKDRHTTPAFVRRCPPPPRGRWAEHVTMKRSEHYKSRSRTKTYFVEWVRVSDELWGMLRALENFFAVTGFLVIDPKT